LGEYIVDLRRVLVEGSVFDDDLYKFIPTGNTISTPLKPMVKEERLNYDFDKSPRPNTNFLTCRLASLGEWDRKLRPITFIDYANGAIGYALNDKNGS
jgi:hypothetical protein